MPRNKVYEKGFKAFEKGLICRGKQYKENTIFEEPEANICFRGMHFCKEPLDVLNYYPLVDDKGNMTEFAEVEALAECQHTDDKSCTKKLKIKSKLSFADLFKFEFDAEFWKEINKIKDSDLNNDENFAQIGSSGNSAKIGSSGNYAQIGSSGDYAQIGSSGDYAQIGSSGDYAQIGSSGNSAKIGSSGDYAQIGSSGDYAQIGSSGDYAQIGSSGDYAQIGSSGNSAKIGSSGDSATVNSTGEDSVIMCAGRNSRAKAKKGNWITLAEWTWDNDKERYIPKCVKTEYVDGGRIKEDTLYCLKNGEFTEVK